MKRLVERDKKERRDDSDRPKMASTGKTKGDVPTIKPYRTHVTALRLAGESETQVCPHPHRSLGENANQQCSCFDLFLDCFVSSSAIDQSSGQLVQYWELFLKVRA